MSFHASRAALVVASSSCASCACATPRRLSTSTLAGSSRSGSNTGHGSFLTARRSAPASARAAFHTASAAHAKAAKGAAKAPPRQDDAPKAAPTAKLVESADPNVSVCPAGTVLSGLGIYKDKAEPIALPDDEYPSWLWSLVETSTNASGGGLSIAGSANMSKGELRVAQKKAMKELRAKAEAAKRAAQRAALSAAATGASEEGAQRAAAAAASASMGEDVPIESAPQTVDPAVAMAQAQQAAARDEARQKVELRKANKAKIKSKNFLSAA